MDEKNTNAAAETKAGKADEKQAPVDYSRYMPTLNRIYRRGNSPSARRLQDGRDGAKGKTENKTDGKKDYSFWIVLGAFLIFALVYWVVKNQIL